MSVASLHRESTDSDTNRPVPLVLARLVSQNKFTYLDKFSEDRTSGAVTVKTTALLKASPRNCKKHSNLVAIKRAMSCCQSNVHALENGVRIKGSSWNGLCIVL